MGQQFGAAERVEKRGGSLRKQVGAGEEMRDGCEGKVYVTLEESSDVVWSGDSCGTEEKAGGGAGD